MQAERTPVEAVDKFGKTIAVGDYVKYLGHFGADSANSRVLEIGSATHRVGEQFGGYEYRPVKIQGYGWINPVAQCRKVRG